MIIAVFLALGLGLALVATRRDGRPSTVRDRVTGWPGDARGTPAATAWSVARFEGRMLVRHPAFVFGMAVTPLILYLATGQEVIREWWRVELGLVLGLVPLGWAAIIAANLGALRARRHGVEELLGSLPASSASRTTGHLLSGLFTAPVVIVVTLAWMVLLESWRGIAGTPAPLELAAGLFIVGGAVVVGVVVARWLPHPIFAVVAVVVVSVLEDQLAGDGTWSLRFLAFLVPPSESGQQALDFRHPLLHLVYLAGLTGTIGAIAVLRHGWRRPAGAALGAAVLFAGLAGWAQTRPMSDGEVEERLAYLTRPAEHQRCETHEGVAYCAYRSGAGGQIAAWRSVVDAVRESFPAAVTRDLRIVERVPTATGNGDCAQVSFAETVPAPVARRIDPVEVWPRDADVHPGTDGFPCGGRSSGGTFLGVQIGAWAVGLPPSRWHDDRQCQADGQARSAAALWLGSHALERARPTLDELLDQSKVRAVTDTHRLTFPAAGTAGWNEPPMWGVAWHTDDVRAARLLLDRRASEVQRVLEEHWAAIVTGEMTTAALLEAAGVEADLRWAPAPGMEAC